MNLIESSSNYLQYIQEKIIKTDEVIKLFDSKKKELKKLDVKHKKLLQKYLQKNNELSNINTTWEKQAEELKAENTKLLNKYNEYVNEAEKKYQTCCLELVELNKTYDNFKKKHENIEQKEKSNHNTKKLQDTLNETKEQLKESIRKYEELQVSTDQIISDLKIECKNHADKKNEALKQLAKARLDSEELKKIPKTNSPTKVKLKEEVTELQSKLDYSKIELDLLNQSYKSDIEDLKKKHHEELEKFKSKTEAGEKLIKQLEKEKKNLDNQIKELQKSVDENNEKYICEQNALKEKIVELKKNQEKEIKTCSTQTDYEDIYNLEDILNETRIVSLISPMTLEDEETREDIGEEPLEEIANLENEDNFAVPEIIEDSKEVQEEIKEPQEVTNIVEETVIIENRDQCPIPEIRLNGEKIQEENEITEEPYEEIEEPQEIINNVEEIVNLEHGDQNRIKVRSSSELYSEIPVLVDNSTQTIEDHQELIEFKFQPSIILPKHNVLNNSQNNKLKSRVTKRYKNNKNKMLSALKSSNINLKTLMQNYLNANNKVMILSPSILNQNSMWENYPFMYQPNQFQHFGQNPFIPSFTCNSHKCRTKKFKHQIDDSDSEEELRNFLKDYKHRVLNKYLTKNNKRRKRKNKKSFKRLRTSSESSESESDSEIYRKTKKRTKRNTSKHRKIIVNSESEIEDDFRIHKRNSTKKNKSVCISDSNSDSEISEIKTKNSKLKQTSNKSIIPSESESEDSNKKKHNKFEQSVKNVKKSCKNSSKNHNSKRVISKFRHTFTKTYQNNSKIKSKSKKFITESESNSENENITEEISKNKSNKSELLGEKEIENERRKKFDQDLDKRESENNHRTMSNVGQNEDNLENNSEILYNSMEDEELNISLSSEENTDHIEEININNEELKSACSSDEGFKGFELEDTRSNLSKYLKLVHEEENSMHEEDKVNESTKCIPVKKPSNLLAMNKRQKAILKKISVNKCNKVHINSNIQAQETNKRKSEISCTPNKRLKLLLFGNVSDSDSDCSAKESTNTENNTVKDINTKKRISLLNKKPTPQNSSDGETTKKVITVLKNIDEEMKEENKPKRIFKKPERGNLTSVQKEKIPVAKEIVPKSFSSQTFDHSTYNILERLQVPSKIDTELVDHITYNPVERPHRVENSMKNKQQEISLEIAQKFVLDIATLDWDKALLTTAANYLSDKDLKIVARIIVNQASKDFSQVFDKSFTPPAPLLTSVQQKILVLVNVIEQNSPDFHTVFLEALEKRLLSEKRVEVVHSLSRIFVSQCKLKYELERVRMFCCHAAYFMGDLILPLMYIILTSWGDVIPNADKAEDIPLLKTLVFVIQLKTCKTPGYNNRNLMQLLSDCYGYKLGIFSNDEIMNKLINFYSASQSHSSYTSIVLLCKHLPSKWTYTQIKNHLLPLLARSEKKEMTVSLINRLMENFNVASEQAYISDIRNNLAICISASGIQQ